MSGLSAENFRAAASVPRLAEIRNRDRDAYQRADEIIAAAKERPRSRKRRGNVTVPAEAVVVAEAEIIKAVQEEPTAATEPVVGLRRGTPEWRAWAEQPAEDQIAAAPLSVVPEPEPKPEPVKPRARRPVLASGDAREGVRRSPPDDEIPVGRPHPHRQLDLGER